MLEHRSEEQEIMDDLTISGHVVDQTLRELNTINKRLGGNRISVSAFKQMSNGKEGITLADLGCGGGDVMVEMARWAQRKKLNATFIGVDANKNIVAYAKKNTESFSEIKYSTLNILSDEFKKQSFDIIHCCLFIHHFTTKELISLFRQFRDQARVGVIINDLHRHPLAFWSIAILTSLFSKSIMVKNDASVSVSRGFKRHELKSILKEAGIEKYRLIWKWAFRWELTF